MEKSKTIDGELSSKIIEHLQHWFPVIPEEDEEEESISIIELQNKILKELTTKDKSEVSKDTIRGFINGIMQSLNPLGVLQDVEWNEGKIKCNSYESYVLMKSWLEYLRCGKEYIDWRDDNDKSRTKRIDFLKDIERERLFTLDKTEIRPIRVNHAVVALIKGHCKLNNQDVFLFQKKSLTDFYGNKKVNWRHIGGKLRFLDIKEGGNPREVFNTLFKNNFKAKKEWMHRCLRRELNKALDIKSDDYEVHSLDIRQELFPLTDVRISGSQYIVTQYHYHPFELVFKKHFDETELFSRKNLIWLTLDFILSKKPEVNEIRVIDRVFKVAVDSFGRKWLKDHLKNSTPQSIPYNCTKHIHDKIHITQDLYLYYDKKVLFSEEQNEFEKKISETKKNFLVTLAERKPHAVSYEELLKATHIGEPGTLQKLKWNIEKDDLSNLKKSYIENHAGYGYSLIE